MVAAAHLVSESELTEVTLNALKSNESGITEYPILDFDGNALTLLYEGVEETLRQSDVKPNGGMVYRVSKRMADIVVSGLALIMIAITIGGFA